ncbi:DUF2513 domain-containing protein [Gardnerella vaginalis]|uniref:DUF2513 domain-containing protein n=1 Tax=Gardnerella vaginalis TaxID=2702 RepID=A0A133NTC8_GARVA|nr:DUF2513 domain-containing protein [Gardnerella vaginalis]KXA19508.1 hypothetical protein HMPREF3216_00053 [Gardnerella vaginalis]
MDLVREILIEVSKSDKEVRASDIAEKSSKYSLEEIIYNIKIMGEGNLINVYIDEREVGVVDAYIMDITWHGNEFLDSISSNEIWEKIKNNFSDKIINIPFDILTSLAKLYLKSKLGLF